MNKSTVTQQAKTTNAVLPSAQGLLQRQCACGNHTLAGVECAECAKKKNGLQFKLAVGASNDPLEREADRVAEQVMATTAYHSANDSPSFIQRYVGHAAEQSQQDVKATPYNVRNDIVFGGGRFAPAVYEESQLTSHELTHVLQQPGADDIRAGRNNENMGTSFINTANTDAKIQRSCSTCEQENEESSMQYVQRYSAHNDDTAGVGLANAGQCNQTIDDAILSIGGSPLTPATRHFFESRFNRDLSAVRLHTGAVANDFCRHFDAHAFTYGSHVWIGNGLKSSPSFVMAHELAHVVQQTQPAPLNNGVPNNSGELKQPLHSDTKSVRRLPFWVPIGGKKGSIMTGSEIHKELLDAVNGKNNVEVEAPVPNAIRSDWGLGLQGFADMYRASSRVGVFFQPRQGLSIGDKHGNERHTKPAKPDKAGKNPKPVATKTGSIDEIAAGPKDIELGELKPAALTELSKGDKQLGNYEEGFKDAAALTNLWAAARKGSSSTPPSWTLNSVKRLPNKDVQVAAKHDPADATTGADRNLALADIDENSPKGKGKDVSKYSVRKVFVPKTYLGEEIKGKLYMEPFGQGLWMYYARPTDFSKALDLPKFKSGDQKRALMAVANAVQDEVIGGLTRAPKQVKLFAHNRQRAVDTQRLTLAKATMQISRKAKPVKLKDDFDQKAYEKWSKRQSELGKEVRGKDTAKGTEKTFKKLEFLEYAAKAENALASKAHKKGVNFPTAADLQIKVETGTGKDKVTKNTSLDKIFGWMERWTSPGYKVLGKFRQIFGRGFVTAVNKFHTIKESISTKVHEFFKKRTTLKKTAGLLVKALGIALKQVIHIIVPQTVNLVVEAVGRGIEKKLAAMFEDTFVEKSIESFKEWSDKIKDYGEQANTYIEQVKKDFLQKFDWVDDIIDEVKWFWRIIKIGRVLLKCRKPPILGCLSLLKDAATDNELNCILCIPWVQKQVAQRVMDVKWFANMPTELATMIMTVLHDAVPEKADILRDIFSEKIAAQGTNIDDLVPECDAKCSGFPLFEGAGSGGSEVKQGDVDNAEKMSDFAEKLSKEQLEELMKEAERRGMLNKPFDQEQAEKMLKDLEAKKAQEGDKKSDKDTPPPAGDAQKVPPPGQKLDAKPPEKKPTSPEQKKADDTEKAQPDKQSEQQKQADKTQQPQQKKPSSKPKPKAAKPGAGATGKSGSGGEGKCVWDPSQIDIGAWVLEPDSSGFLAYGDTSTPFPKNPITAKCAGRFIIKNDFGFGWCERTGKFKAPTVTTEITFNGKELFKKTDKSPKVWSSYYIEPNWSDRINLPLITESGELKIKLTLSDPDSGKVVTFDDKVIIAILTKDLCCNCIS